MGVRGGGRGGQRHDPHRVALAVRPDPADRQSHHHHRHGPAPAPELGCQLQYKPVETFLVISVIIMETPPCFVFIIIMEARAGQCSLFNATHIMKPN